MYNTEMDGIIFVEGRFPEEARMIRPISVKIHGVLSQAQLKSLNDVKKAMASQARGMGGNAIVEFKYGQRSTFLTTLLGIDDVSWYGEGVLCEIPHGAYSRLLANCQRRTGT